MFGHSFYHGTIRRYVVLFGTLFNDIYINRPDPTHNRIITVKVPVAYGPRDKSLARVTADPELTRQPAIVLPRISFEITDIQYAPSRKLNTIGKKYVVDGDNTTNIQYQYNPVPYDINFSMSVIVKNSDDGTRIIEQILPFFTPEWTTTVQLIPDMDITMDIPIILNDVSVQDIYEGDFETRRALTWNFTFTLKGYLFGPVKKAAIIKFANSNIFSTMTSNSQVTNINVAPGLLANGSPTTNASLSVDSTLIFPDDDFGFIVAKTNLNE